MDIIRERKSVRTYSGEALSEEDRKKLSDCIARAENPYGIPVEFRFLDPEKYGLKSPVLNGETLYLAAKVKKVPHFEEAYGYCFESVVLYAQSLGIGTVWIGGTMNRENFEKAMDLCDDEVMPCVTPVGYPAAKMSFKETLMRKGVRADDRLPLSAIAFEKDMGRALSEKSLEIFGAALEAVRWAPSAVNKQPWRIVIEGNKAHFFEKPDKGFTGSRTGDLQRIDLGIAMYHFVFGMEQAGRKALFCPEEIQFAVPTDWQYVTTYVAE